MPPCLPVGGGVFCTPWAGQGECNEAVAPPARRGGGRVRRDFQLRARDPSCFMSSAGPPSSNGHQPNARAWWQFRSDTPFDSGEIVPHARCFSRTIWEAAVFG